MADELYGLAESTKPIWAASIWERPRGAVGAPSGKCGEVRKGPRRDQRGSEEFVDITSACARATVPRRPSAPMTVAVTS